MLVYLITVVAGAGLLVYGADRVVAGASSLAENLGVSRLIIGLTVVSLGTSLPELLVTATATLTGHPDVGVGNVLGSNIANIGLILGVTSIIHPVLIHRGLLRREYPVLIAATLLAWLFGVGGTISRPEGLILILGICSVLTWMVVRARRGEEQVLVEAALPSAKHAALPLSRSLAYLALGLLLLVVGSRMFVYGGVGVAEQLGVSQLVIGLTLIALGTSLPELATTLVGALKKQDDIAVGNVVGSNLFNTLAILGIPAALKPLDVSRAALTRDFPVVLLASLALWPICRSWRGEKGRVNRVEGAALFSGYCLYILYLFMRAS